MRERHGTPFEHNFFRFHIKAPLFVTREWQRHRIGSFNERSGRYSELPDEFYVPAASACARRSASPARTPSSRLPDDAAEEVRSGIESSYAESYGRYQRAARRRRRQGGRAQRAAGRPLHGVLLVGQRALADELPLAAQRGGGPARDPRLRGGRRAALRARDARHARDRSWIRDGRLPEQPPAARARGAGARRRRAPRHAAAALGARPRPLLRSRRRRGLDADRLRPRHAGHRAPLAAGARAARAPARAPPRDHALPPRSHRREHAPGRAHRRRGDRAGQARPRADRAHLARPRLRRALPALPRGARHAASRIADALRRDEEDELPIAPVEPTHLVDEGDTLDLAGEPFDVLVLPGHADGHIALLGRHSGRLFGGDVLLDEITPNVGRWEDNEPDPLGRYLETLARIEELAPAVVYPGPPRRDRAARGARAGDRDAPRRAARRARAGPARRRPQRLRRRAASSGAARSASTSSASRWPRRSRTSSGSSGWAARCEIEPNRWRAA